VLKLIVLIKRRRGLDSAEFRRLYEQEHAPLAKRVVPAELDARILHYVQNHALAPRTGEPAYDCVTEIGFADESGVRAWTEWYRGPGGRVLREDEERFMDLDARVVLLSDERTITQRPIEEES
jgi:uncharacterized protein (TIGR02118 family)